MAELVVGARRCHPFWGPKKLLVTLAAKYPGLDLPAGSTVARILSRRGLVMPRGPGRRRAPPYSRPFLGYDRPNADGFRVLAIAYRDFDPKEAYSRTDEADLVLRGYVAFFDPPKDSAPPAVEALHQHGVEIKVLTGDNEAVLGNRKPGF